MSALRLQAALRVTSGSGFAAWALAQLQARNGMAYHLHAGEPWQERSSSSTRTVSGGPKADRFELFRADALWPDTPGNRALAVQTFDTLVDAGVLARLEPFRPDDPDRPPSFVRAHVCEHDTRPPAACTELLTSTLHGPTEWVET